MPEGKVIVGRNLENQEVWLRSFTGDTLINMRNVAYVSLVDGTSVRVSLFAGVRLEVFSGTSEDCLKYMDQVSWLLGARNFGYTTTIKKLQLENEELRSKLAATEKDKAKLLTICRDSMKMVFEMEEEENSEDNSEECL